MWLAMAAFAVVLGARGFMQSSPEEPGERVAFAHGAAGVERITERDCVSRPGRVWLVVKNIAECIAYIGPPPPSTNSTAVIYFEGDVPDDRLSAESAAAMRLNYERISAGLTRRYTVPVVVIGRLGLMGSSGDHVKGGRRDEAEVMNAAVDAVAANYGVRKLALTGQSGGARIVAQLLLLGRSDIVCTAMASGAYGTPGLRGGGTVSTNIFGDPGRGYLVPLRDAEQAPRSAARRDFVIGDPRDSVAAFAEQKAWAEKLASLGHRVDLIEATGNGPGYHGLSLEGMRAAALCANGASDQEIRTAVKQAR
jgi:pimeloyl-ACP methyl ester carboxylesterase